MGRTQEALLAAPDQGRGRYPREPGLDQTTAHSYGPAAFGVMLDGGDEIRASAR